MAEAEQVPAGVDPTRPSPARMYDYMLGGTRNLQVDRDATERFLAQYPDLLDAASANRGFLRRAARLMAQTHGIRQFIDIGSGLPTQNNTHETVHQIAPDARIVYVDLDPMVLTYAPELLTDDGTTAVVQADLRDPDSVLNAADVRRLIDFSQPVGVLFVAVLHFIPAEDDPYGSVRAFCAQMAPGSFLAVSHISSDGTAPAVMATIRDAYRTASAPAVFRSLAEIEGFFAGLEIAHPGIVEVSAWRARATRIPALRILGGVGAKQ